MIVINSVTLAAAIIDAGLGQVEICTKAGVGHQTLAKMLKGEMVRISSVSRICKVLDVPAAQILEGSPNWYLRQGDTLISPQDNAQSPCLAVA
jgi:DNA-binding Xre family transcriptional regulator